MDTEEGRRQRERGEERERTRLTPLNVEQNTLAFAFVGILRVSAESRAMRERMVEAGSKPRNACSGLAFRFWSIEV